MSRRRRARRDDEPVALGEALAEVGRDLGLAEPRAVARVLEQWAEIVGEHLAAHARPRSLRDGLLTVEVDDPAYATELRYREGDVRRRCADVAGDGVVAAVRVVVGRPGRHGDGTGVW